MILRKKIFFAVCAGLFFLSCALLISFYFISRSNFQRLEERTARLAVNEAVIALNNDIDDLGDLASQLAADRDTKDFVDKPGAANLKRFFSEFVFDQKKINYAILVNKKGKIVYTIGYDHIKKSQVPLPPKLLDNITPQSPLLNHPNSLSFHKGIISMDNTQLLLASRPIPDTKSPEKNIGTLILGQKFGITEGSHLSQLNHISVNIYNIGSLNMADKLNKILESLSDDKPIAVAPIDNNIIAGYKYIKDIYGVPAFLIKTNMPRQLSREASLLFKHLFYAVIIIIILFVFVFAFFMEKLLVTRLVKISKTLSKIIASGKFNERVTVDNTDDLAIISDSVNYLLIQLDEREQFLQKSSQIYQLLTENMQDIIIQTDRKGTYQYASPSHKTILGHSPEKMMGKSVFDLINPQDLKNVYALAKKLGRRKVPIRFECRVHHSAGYYVWLEIAVKPLFDDNAALIGAVIAARDISTRKKIQDET
jgi:PAS domain S-box-containing protein